MAYAPAAACPLTGVLLQRLCAAQPDKMGPSFGCGEWPIATPHGVFTATKRHASAQ